MGELERRADPKDRRIWRLHLTSPATPELHELKRHKNELRDEMTAGLSPAELDRLIDSLLKLKANLTDGRASLRAV